MLYIYIIATCICLYCVLSVDLKKHRLIINVHKTHTFNVKEPSLGYLLPRSLEAYFTL